MRLAYGVWEGVPIPLEGDLLDTDDEESGGEPMWVLTFAAGWHGFGSTTQFFFTPKLWRFVGFNLYS